MDEGTNAYNNWPSFESCKRAARDELEKCKFNNNSCKFTKL